VRSPEYEKERDRTDDHARQPGGQRHAARARARGLVDGDHAGAGEDRAQDREEEPDPEADDGRQREDGAAQREARRPSR
jgi:hypothetical protein